MDDVAREAGVSKGGLYLYFKGKDELIDALVGWIMDRETRRLAEARGGAGSVEGRLMAFVHGYAEDVVDMKRLAPVLLEAYVRASRSATVRRVILRFFDTFEAEFAGLVREGVESGEFRAVEPDAVAVQITALLEGLALFWLIDPERIDLPGMIDGGVHLLLIGLRAPNHEREER